MTEDLNETQVCYKHKDRKTLLRCNKCGRPICLECAVQTPTGYRCKDCIREQQKVFNTSETGDFFIGGVIAAVLGFAGSFVGNRIPFLPSFLSALIVGGLFGKLICSCVRKAVNRRRSAALNTVVITAAGIGGALPAVLQILQMLQGLPIGSLQILFSALYIAVLCLTVRAEMNGMVF